MPPAPQPEPEKTQATKTADGLQWFFGFLIVFTGFQFATRPVVNSAQLIFRLVLLGVGIVGSIGVLVWRLASRK